MTTPVEGEARIVVQMDTTRADDAIQQFTRDASGRLRDLRGRFVAEGAVISRSLDEQAQSADGVSESLRGIGTESERAGDALGRFTRDANGRLRDMRGRFVSEGSAISHSLDTALHDLPGEAEEGGDRTGRGFVSGIIGRITSNLGPGITSASTSILSTLQIPTGAVENNPYLAAAGAAIGLSIATVAITTVGALISAATISVAGLGVIGIGAAILKSRPEIKAAFGGLVKEAKNILTAAAEPLIKPFQDAAKQFNLTLLGLTPQIHAAFAGSAPLVAPLVNGLNQLAEGVLPGLIRLIQSGQPVFDALGQSLGILGQSVGQAFSNISAGGPAAGQALIDVARLLGKLIEGVSLLIVGLAIAYGQIRSFITGTIRLFQLLFDVLVGHSIIPDLVSRILGLFGTLVSGAVRHVLNLVNTVIGLFSSLLSRGASAAAQLRDSVVRAFSQLYAGARNNIGNLLDLAFRLPRLILSAVGDLGHILYRSGRSAVQGLINGMKSLFGSVAGTASSLAGIVSDHLPFSPAKKGPLSGRGYTLYSGQALVSDFARGMRMASPKIDTAISAVLPSISSAIGQGPVRPVPVSGGDTVINLSVDNHGVLGSQRDVQNWLVASLTTLNSQGRLRSITA